MKTRRILPGAAMRAGKRAARREVQKHRLDRGRLLVLAKNHSTKGLGENKQ
jgi:hypothetical protein